MVAIKNNPSKYEVYQFKLEKFDELNKLLNDRLIKNENGVGINNASFGKDSVIEGPIPENSYLVNFRGNGKFCIISEEKFNRDFTIISEEHSKRYT